MAPASQRSSELSAKSPRSTYNVQSPINNGKGFRVRLRKKHSAISAKLRHLGRPDLQKALLVQPAQTTSESSIGSRSETGSTGSQDRKSVSEVASSTGSTCTTASSNKSKFFNQFVKPCRPLASRVYITPLRSSYIQVGPPQRNLHIVAICGHNQAMLHGVLSLFTLRHPPNYVTRQQSYVYGLESKILQISSDDELEVFLVSNVRNLRRLLKSVIVDVMVFCCEFADDHELKTLEEGLIKSVKNDACEIPKILCSVKTNVRYERDIAGSPLVVDRGYGVTAREAMKRNGFSGAAQVDLMDNQDLIDYLFVDILLKSTMMRINKVEKRSERSRKRSIRPECESPTRKG